MITTKLAKMKRYAAKVEESLNHMGGMIRQLLGAMMFEKSKWQKLKSGHYAFRYVGSSKRSPDSVCQPDFSRKIKGISFPVIERSVTVTLIVWHSASAINQQQPGLPRGW